MIGLAVRTPESVAEVVAGLGANAEVIAGGTAIMPRINTEVPDVEALVSLRHAGLSGIQLADATATLGAATTLSALACEDALAFLWPAVKAIASPSIRNLATVGGNLFVAAPYGDLAVCLLALDATVDIAGPDGRRRAAPVADVLRDGVGVQELITHVSFRVPTPASWHFTKAMRRRQSSASIITVAAALTTDGGGRITDARIALGGAGPRPVRSPSAEAALLHRPLDRASAEAAGLAALDDAEPPTDAYASSWYRRRVLPVHVRRALLGE